MIEAGDLQHLVAVYRNRSFRLAAEALGVSQSAVTKRIQRLEAEIGTRLFNRTTRSVEPTDAARQLIDRAEAAINAVEAFDAQARLMQTGEIGSLRIGAIALAADTVIAHSLAALSRSHPRLRIDVEVGGSNIYRDLVRGDLDLAIGDEANFLASSHAATLRMTPLHTQRLGFVHRPDHPCSRSTDLQKLLSFPLAIPSRYYNENKLFEVLADAASPLEAPLYRLNSLSACLQIAALSDVITLAPQSIFETRSVTAERTSGATQLALISSAVEVGLDVHLVLASVARHSPTPATQAFLQACLSQAS